MQREISIDYIRCPKCSMVYEATEDKCPQCGQDTVITEEAVLEKVFNLND